MSELNTTVFLYINKQFSYSRDTGTGQRLYAKIYKMCTSIPIFDLSISLIRWSYSLNNKNVLIKLTVNN
jgi:hypothetical protein